MSFAYSNWPTHLAIISAYHFCKTPYRCRHSHVRMHTQLNLTLVKSWNKFMKIRASMLSRELELGWLDSTTRKLLTRWTTLNSPCPHKMQHTKLAIISQLYTSPSYRCAHTHLCRCWMLDCIESFYTMFGGKNGRPTQGDEGKRGETRIRASPVVSIYLIQLPYWKCS